MTIGAGPVELKGDRNGEANTPEGVQNQKSGQTAGPRPRSIQSAGRLGRQQGAQTPPQAATLRKSGRRLLRVGPEGDRPL
jgi:hypothetical protein